MQVPLDLQQVAAELGALAAAEDGQRPLLAVLPAGELVLTIADLKEKNQPAPVPASAGSPVI